ncbi:hypothetical protein ANCDUO_21173 [Ancylostoma duodenale]|uniref:Uncharacterized protein n=1 Tax=Ancylostoma duodenale TaxID=51022 RepID=A0A0C2FPY2_9BILA|nr:hypothetical protein ANCDUO_21173 [Ancylostoma duodenale]
MKAPLFQKVGDESKCEGVAKESQLPTKEELQKLLTESAEHDEKYPEHERKKRQVIRQSYQDYLDNLGRADYDVRIEEGWQDILYPFGAWAMDEQLMGQAGRETQANLGFDCPFFGFRFNYTFVYPMGMVSFAQPSFATPPWTFPNPSWPKQRVSDFY